MFKLLIALRVVLLLFICAFASAGDESFLVEFKVQLNSQSTGSFVMEVHPSWAPLGAARIKELIQAKFYDQCRFFRVISGFMAQFGINGDSLIQKKWVGASIKDDPVLQHNKRGFVSFAMAGKNTRTSQLFINLVDNKSLDSEGFSPFGRIISGMSVVDKFYSGYGEGAPGGQGPEQGLIQSRGNPYIKQKFPLLSYILQARIKSSGTGTQSKTMQSTKFVHCDTTKGPVVIEMHSDWAPVGAARFLAMVKDGFFDNSSFFRVLPGFLVQFGIASTQKMRNKWDKFGTIKDDAKDPKKWGGTFPKGAISFAGYGKNSRTVQLFFTYGAGVVGGSPWEVPLGVVTEGFSNLEKLRSYGDLSVFNKGGPDMAKIQQEGNDYIKKSFPQMDFFKTCRLVSRSQPRCSSHANCNQMKEFCAKEKGAQPSTCLPCSMCKLNSDSISGECPQQCGGETSIWKTE